ncbi:MAG: CvpA family protein [Candidatus Kuenenia sp.]|nr:CvpA family protein [Candidatus Kuenenia hertensis]
MNWIDITIFVVLCISIIFGFIDGPICQFLRISSLFISFCAALFYNAIISNIFKNVFSVSLNNILSYFIIFALVALITTIIADFPKNMIDNLKIGSWYNLFGAVLGLVKGTIFCGAIIFGILSLCNKPACEVIYTSKVATAIGNGMQNIASITSNSFLSKMRKNNNENRENKVSNNTKITKGTKF